MNYLAQFCLLAIVVLHKLPFYFFGLFEKFDSVLWVLAEPESCKFLVLSKYIVSNFWIFQKVLLLLLLRKLFLIVKKVKIKALFERKK